MIRRIIIFTASYLFFSPLFALTLSNSIMHTVQNNPDIMVSERDQQAVQAGLRQAKAGYFPRVDLNVGYGVDNNYNSNTIGTNNPSVTMPKREASLVMNQNLFNGFATQADVARNKAQLSSATLKSISAIQDAIQRNIEVYIGVLREQELLKLAEDNLSIHQKITHMIRQRIRNGISRRGDLFQAEGRLSLAQSNLLAEQSNLADAKANFYRTVGLHPENLTKPLHPSAAYRVHSELQALATALRNNPILRSANADIVAAREQYNMAVGAAMPKVDLVLGANRDRNVGGIRGASFEQYAMLRASYNLYRGGGDQARIQQTVYQYQSAIEIKQRAKQQLIEAVKLSWDLLMTARKQLASLEMHQYEAAKTTNVYNKEFFIGQRTLLDLLDSENELFAAKRSYVAGSYQLLQSEYQILKDMGLAINALSLPSYLIKKDYAPYIAENEMLYPSKVKFPIHPMIVSQEHHFFPVIHNLHDARPTHRVATQPMPVVNANDAYYAKAAAAMPVVQSQPAPVPPSRVIIHRRPLPAPVTTQPTIIAPPVVSQPPVVVPLPPPPRPQVQAPVATPQPQMQPVKPAANSAKLNHPVRKLQPEAAFQARLQAELAASLRASANAMVLAHAREEARILAAADRRAGFGPFDSIRIVA